MGIGDCCSGAAGRKAYVLQMYMLLRVYMHGHELLQQETAVPFVGVMHFYCEACRRD